MIALIFFFSFISTHSKKCTCHHYLVYINKFVSVVDSNALFTCNIFDFSCCRRRRCIFIILLHQLSCFHSHFMGMNAVFTYGVVYPFCFASIHFGSIEMSMFLTYKLTEILKWFDRHFNRLLTKVSRFIHEEELYLQVFQ